MLYALILYVSSWFYSLTSTLNDRFLLKNFQSFCQKSAERKLPKKYILYFLWCLVWGSKPGFMSNKPTHFLLDYSVELLTKLWNWVPLQDTCGGWLNPNQTSIVNVINDCYEAESCHTIVCGFFILYWTFKSEIAQSNEIHMTSEISCI